MRQLNVTYDHIRDAQDRIRGFVDQTPLHQSPKLAAVTGAKSIWFKEENFQRTGAFKIRGVMNRMLLMTPEERRRGVVTASCGNHGLAITHVAKMLGIRACVVVPEYTISEKRVGILRNGGDLLEYGTTYDEAEAQAQKLARENDWYLIHGSEDPAIIAGHGTIGLEMLEGEENPGIDTLVVPAGGGALISGLSITAKAIQKDIQLIGVQSVASPPWYYSFRAGEIIPVTYEASLAEGLSGGIGPGCFEIVSRLVDDMVLVEEPDIAMAMAWLYEEHNLKIEGSAAVGVAALLTGCIDVKEKNVATILTGGNVDVAKFEEIFGMFGKMELVLPAVKGCTSDWMVRQKNSQKVTNMSPM
jgi:threonine dehydratase